VVPVVGAYSAAGTWRAGHARGPGEGRRRVEGRARHGIWADDLADLADKADAESPARNLAVQAADHGHRAAGHLDKRGAEGVVEGVQGFARRRPAVFLGGTVLAGFAGCTVAVLLSLAAVFGLADVMDAAWAALVPPGCGL
jgi:hypothetical protein